jgi:hypothetical protein
MTARMVHCRGKERLGRKPPLAGRPDRHQPQIQLRTGKPLSWIYFTATLDAAIWGAELAAGSGRERITSWSRPAFFPGNPDLIDK